MIFPFNVNHALLWYKLRPQLNVTMLAGSGESMDFINCCLSMSTFRRESFSHKNMTDIPLQKNPSTLDLLTVDMPVTAQFSVVSTKARFHWLTKPKEGKKQNKQQISLTCKGEWQPFNIVKQLQLFKYKKSRYNCMRLIHWSTAI